VAFSTFLGVICLQISVNALNDVEDHLRLIDLPGTLGGSGVIQKGWMSAFQLNTLGYVFLGLGILGGLPAVLIRPPLLLCFGLLGVLGVLAYSGKPLGIKYRALGDLVIFVLLGPLIAMGFAQAVMGRFDLSVFCLGSAFGFLSCAILHANNFQDIEFDSSYGIRTLATSLGFQGSRLFFGILIGLSFVSLASGCLFGELPMGVLLLTCLGLPVAWTLIFRVFKASGPASALLSGLRHDVAKFHWIFGGLVLAGFVLVGFATQLGQW
jgi:1,4-dihydroxy-2-naphthoate octaprenyltransferase